MAPLAIASLPRQRTLFSSFAKSSSNLTIYVQEKGKIRLKKDCEMNMFAIYLTMLLVSWLW